MCQSIEDTDLTIFYPICYSHSRKKNKIFLEELIH